MDHITSLERSLLADFHALLEHFEENHVVVLAPNGKRVYPREGLRAVPLDPASTPSSSRASSVSPASLSPSPKSTFTVPPVYTPFTPSLPVDPAHPLFDSSEIVISQLPDFDFSLQPSFFPPLTPDPSSSSEDEAISPTEPPSNSLSDRRPFTPTAAGEKRRMSKSAKSRRHHPSGASHSKRREKMYRCPENGCVKSYLNPNGLKYHLEKGTCKFAQDEEDAMHVPVNDDLDKIEESSPVDDSDSAFTPSPNSHHPVPINPAAWGTPPHIYAAAARPAEAQPDDRSSSSVLPSTLPPQPSPLGHPYLPLPQQQQHIQYHYPVPTYPHGYIYAQQQRSYYPSELATYETPASLPAAMAGVAPTG